MKRDGRNIVEGFVDRLMVQGFDVGERVSKFVPREANLISGETVKHEGIV